MFETVNFSNVSSEKDAYLLGWCTTSLDDEKDQILIKVPLEHSNLSAKFEQFSFVNSEGEDQYNRKQFKSNSVQVITNLKLKIGTAATATVPDLTTDELKWAFVRGVFDSKGLIRNSSEDYNKLTAVLPLDSSTLLDSIEQFCGISCMNDGNCIEFDGNNALDFFYKMYYNSSSDLRSSNNYNVFLSWIKREPKFKTIPFCKFLKADPNAVIPTKTRFSDVGYDLTCIKVDKTYGSKTTMYDTGIKVAPEYGYYTEIVPRSSIVKTGYILSNSIGIIDPTYLGTLKVVLTKVDDTLPDLVVPFTCTQLILKKAEPFILREVVDETDLGKTSRGDKGFGSTGSHGKNDIDSFIVNPVETTTEPEDTVTQPGNGNKNK